MPKVVREDIDNLSVILNITIGKEDYLPTFNEEMKKLGAKSKVRGFRKGKPAEGFLKKTHGKKVLNNIVTDLLQKEIKEAIADETHHYLGQPIPAEDHKMVDFNTSDLEDYVFRFELGKAPDFEVKGIDEASEYEFFKVQVPDEKVEERLEFIRKRRGIRSEADDTIQEEDMVTFNAVELDGDAPKADGWKTTFSILVNRIADEDFKKELLTKKKGDTVRFNVYSLEENSEPEHVKKYMLNFTEADLEEGTETGEMYEAVIEKVMRLTSAELNQEFYDQIFGEGKVTSDEQANEELRKSLGGQHTADAETLLYREMHKRLVDLNRENLPLPDDFLRRWVKVSHEKDADKILGDYERFADDMRWSLIKSKLYKHFNLEINQEEVRELATHRVASYFGGYHQIEGIQEVVNRLMQDQEQVNSMASEVLGNKLFYALKGAVKLRDITITVEELKEKVKAIEEEFKKLNEPEPVEVAEPVGEESE